MRKALILFFISISIPSFTQIGRLALSPLQTVTQEIGKTEITFEYSRPAKRGRQIFGGLVPYDELWRTGANRNTTIAFTKDVIINDEILKSGKYALFSVPTKEEWTLYFYTDTDNWDVPEAIDSSKIALKVTVPSYQIALDRERLWINIGDFDNYSFDLQIGWERTEITLPIQLNTAKEMDQVISKTLGGPDYGDYYLAAVYEMESGHNYDRGLKWIEEAIKLNDEVSWWDMRVKAKLLLASGEIKEAKQLAEIGLKLAKEENREYGINEFTSILEN